MIKIQNILKKDNLVAAAGLGAGSLAAEMVNAKVTPMILPATFDKFAPAVPILAGMIIQTSTGFARKVGHGMIANGVANLAKTYLPETFKSSMGVGAYGENVMMGVGNQDTLMGTSPLQAFDYTVTETTGETAY